MGYIFLPLLATFYYTISIADCRNGHISNSGWKFDPRFERKKTIRRSLISTSGLIFTQNFEIPISCFLFSYPFWWRFRVEWAIKHHIMFVGFGATSNREINKQCGSYQITDKKWCRPWLVPANMALVIHSSVCIHLRTVCNEKQKMPRIQSLCIIFWQLSESSQKHSATKRSQFFIQFLYSFNAKANNLHQHIVTHWFFAP